MRVFVNEQPLEVAPGLSLRDAVARFDAGMGRALDEGAAYLTDGVGRTVDPAGPVAEGGIVRVVVSARGGPRTGAGG